MVAAARAGETADGEVEGEVEGEAEGEGESEVHQDEADAEEGHQVPS